MTHGSRARSALPSAPWRVHPSRLGRIAAALCAVVAAAACGDAPTTSPASPAAGALTIRHDYPIFPTWKSYLADYYTRHGYPGGRVTRPSLSCGALEMKPRFAGETVRVFADGEPQMLGAIQIFAQSSANDALLPTYLIFEVPGRFGTPSCGGSWLYAHDPYIEEAQTAAGYGVESTEEPPSNAPEGMEQSAYENLNPAERNLVWWKFFACSALPNPGVCFGTFVAAMTTVREQAEQWAAATGQPGAHNGPQDGLRHTYWQCLLTTTLGRNTAKEWGDAHEQYAAEADEARMDLSNNALGRDIGSRVGTQFSTCADGVMYAFNRGYIQTGLRPAPSFPTPVWAPYGGGGLDQ